MDITQNGKLINLISPGAINHTIDDEPNNMLAPENAALLIVEGDQEGKTIKVTYLNGKIGTLTSYANYPAVYVLKVWATGTTVDSADIKLFE